MMVSLDPETLVRLKAIEVDEGVPVNDLIDQAVTAWSFLKGADERACMAFVALQTVFRRGKDALPDEPLGRNRR